MAYVSLARQYRPQRFEDVHGQGHVTRTLQNAITLGRTGQAYLFTGPRGVGKTTVARILAKALNCEHGPTPEPCGTCETCRRITEGSSLTVIEIDAASHRSIDDIRSLREDVQFTPTDGRVKVYILDEAHQITGPAFEAFLKTLEEPPAHVVFVLATTEPHKIPATILSRCQRFDFRRLALEDIASRVREVATAEQVSVDEPALYAVSRAADGSLRDALSVLDQIVAYSGEQVTAADVEAVLGTLDVDTRLRLGDLLADGDAAGLLDWLAGLLDAGRDCGLVVAEALAHFRLVLLAALRCAPEQLLALLPDVREKIEAQAGRYTPNRLMAVIEGWAQADKALRWHPQPRLLLEMTLLDLALGGEEPQPAPPPRREPAPRAEPSRPTPPPPREQRRAEPEPEPEPEPLDDYEPYEEPPEPEYEAAPTDEPISEPADEEPVPRPQPVPSPVVSGDEPLTVELVRDNLSAVLDHVRLGWPPLMAHLVHGSVVGVEDNEVTFGFHGWEASLNVCTQPERRKVIEDALEKVLGRPVVFRGELIEDPGGADGESADEAVDDLDVAVGLAKQAFPGASEIDP